MDDRIVVLAVADLLEKPGSWTQGAAARNAAGRPVHVIDEDAVCWCLIGALRRITGDVAIENRVAAKMGLPLPTIGSTHPLATFNDHPDRTQSEVVETIRRHYA